MQIVFFRARNFLNLVMEGDDQCSRSLEVSAPPSTGFLRAFEKARSVAMN